MHPLPAPQRRRQGKRRYLAPEPPPDAGAQGAAGEAGAGGGVRAATSGSDAGSSAHGAGGGADSAAAARADEDLQLRPELRELGDSVTSAVRYEVDDNDDDNAAGSSSAGRSAARVLAAREALVAELGAGGHTTTDSGTRLQQQAGTTVTATSAAADGGNGSSSGHLISQTWQQQQQLCVEPPAAASDAAATGGMLAAAASAAAATALRAPGKLVSPFALPGAYDFAPIGMWLDSSSSGEPEASVGHVGAAAGPPGSEQAIDIMGSAVALASSMHPSELPCGTAAAQTSSLSSADATAVVFHTLGGVKSLPVLQAKYAEVQGGRSGSWVGGSGSQHLQVFTPASDSMSSSFHASSIVEQGAAASSSRGSVVSAGSPGNTRLVVGPHAKAGPFASAAAQWQQATADRTA